MNSQTKPEVKIHPLIRLIRPVLAPTAAADVLAGAAFGGGVAPLPLSMAVLGSVCIYSAGMAQNDFCDRKSDERLHPDRPLVAHPNLLARAGILIALLYSAGLVLAGLAGALWPALGAVLCANAYNLGAKRWFPWDALVLGGARACNLLIGISLAAGSLDMRAIGYASAYLLFIGGVTGASRAEDMEPAQTRRLSLLLAFFVKLLALGGIASVMRADRWLVLVPLALILFWLVRAMAEGTRQAAMDYVFRCLMAIFVIHGVCLWGVGARVDLIPILICAAVSSGLRGLLAPSARVPPQESP
ncbi:MAG: UbiA family prenyltransferase [Planctomycetota bacterium]